MSGLLAQPLGRLCMLTWIYHLAPLGKTTAFWPPLQRRISILATMPLRLEGLPAVMVHTASRVIRGLLCTKAMQLMVTISRISCIATLKCNSFSGYFVPGFAISGVSWVCFGVFLLPTTLRLPISFSSSSATLLHLCPPPGCVCALEREIMRVARHTPRSSGQRCRYVPLTTGRVCSKQLGAHSGHACTCAKGPSLRRHNRIREAWIKQCRQAGWHTDPEQDIHTHDADTKRADLVALTPEGTRVAADVMVTATPTPKEIPTVSTLCEVKVPRFHATMLTPGRPLLGAPPLCP